jgi:hypothetical protein
LAPIKSPQHTSITFDRWNRINRSLRRPIIRIIRIKGSSNQKISLKIIIPETRIIVGITIHIIIIRQGMTPTIIVNMRLIIRATATISTTPQPRIMIIIKTLLMGKSTQIIRIIRQKDTVRRKSNNRMKITAIPNTMFTATTIPQKNQSNIQPKLTKMKVGWIENNLAKPTKHNTPRRKSLSK